MIRIHPPHYGITTACPPHTIAPPINTGLRIARPPKQHTFLLAGVLLELLEALLGEEGEVDKSPVRGPLDLVVAEQHVRAEVVERLLYDVFLAYEAGVVPEIARGGGGRNG